MTQDFYPDLKNLEDGLYAPELVEEFIAKYGLQKILQNASSATNEKSKSRLTDLFRRISNTKHLGEILLFFYSQDQKKIKTLTTFLSSPNGNMMFDHFQNYSTQLVGMIEKEPKLVVLLLGFIEFEGGLKVSKTFQKLYYNHPHLEVLYSEEARQRLKQGVENKDTTVAMRYIELVANIATLSKRAFDFVNTGNMLEETLEYYNTTDTLLKLNVVEVIEIFGNSSWTGEFLRKSPIWEKILAEAFNPDEEFYVRKSLIVLIAKMSSVDCYEITPASAKNFTIFLKEMLSSKIVDEIDAGLDVVSYLGKTDAGFHIISRSEEVTQLYVAISRGTGENTRTKFVASLDSIVERKSGKKPYATVVTLLSCIGDPTLAKTNNLSGNHPILSGLPEFSKWFYSFLLLPFEELKLACLELYRQLLSYKQVCVQLFGSKHAMQFFKKKLTRPDLILLKKALINEILQHGDSTWKGHELEVFANLLRKEMVKGEDNEVEYQVESK